MSDAVLGSLITGGLALLGVIITVWASNNRIQHKVELSQAVTDTKLEDLIREVRTHNNFAQRIPVLEEKMAATERRLEDLEKV